MIYRNNKLRFSLLALLLALALFSNLSFTAGASARSAKGTCMNLGVKGYVIKDSAVTAFRDGACGFVPKENLLELRALISAAA